MMVTIIHNELCRDQNIYQCYTVGSTKHTSFNGGTVLLGKRVDFDHCVVSADFTSETCILSVLTLYTDMSMDGLPTCQIVECNEFSSGTWR